MERSKLARIFLFLSVILVAGTACSLMSGGIPGIPNYPATQTQDAIVNAATPAAPGSGDWTADIQSGQVIFHIPRDASRVTFVDLKLKGWQCGGTTMTTTMQVHADWPIDGNHLSVSIDLGDASSIEQISFDGAFDSATNTWSGTWDGDEYGSHCGGKWQASH